MIRIRVCGSSTPVDPNPGCRNAGQHTPSPRGYMAGIAWVNDMTKTHQQRQCPGCGRWLIWTPKEMP